MKNLSKDKKFILVAIGVCIVCIILLGIICSPKKVSVDTINYEPAVVWSGESFVDETGISIDSTDHSNIIPCFEYDGVTYECPFVIGDLECDFDILDSSEGNSIKDSVVPARSFQPCVLVMGDTKLLFEAFNPSSEEKSILECKPDFISFSSDVIESGQIKLPYGLDKELTVADIQSILGAPDSYCDMDGTYAYYYGNVGSNKNYPTTIVVMFDSNQPDSKVNQINFSFGYPITED